MLNIVTLNTAFCNTIITTAASVSVPLIVACGGDNESSRF